MSWRGFAPPQNRARGSGSVSLTINGAPSFRGRDSRNIEDAGPSNSSPRITSNQTFEQESGVAESYENVTQGRYLTRTGVSAQWHRLGEQRSQRPTAPLPRTGVTEDRLRQLELSSDDSQSDIVTVRGSVNRGSSGDQSNDYGPTVVNGGIAIFGNVERLTIYCQNGAVTRYEIASNNTEENTQSSRQRVLGWLDDVLRSTGLRNSGVASLQHTIQGYDTDAMSHEADRATSTAVTVVFVPEPRARSPGAPVPSLRLSRPSHFVAEKGRPDPTDPSPPNPNSPDPESFNFRRSPFEPGDLLRASGVPVNRQLLIVLKSSGLAYICFSVSADKTAYPAASCVLLENYDGSTQHERRGRKEALALVRVSMLIRSALPSNSRVIPRLVLVIQHYKQLSKIGSLNRDNMRRLVSAWSLESRGIIMLTRE